MTSTSQGRGLFITFEGMDGSGKSTQLRLLATRLREAGYLVTETAEPGGTPIGRQIRQILLNNHNRELSPTAELLLYFASRAQAVDQWIMPAMEAGGIVLSDRFTDSTRAYQGAARRLGSEIVEALDSVACRGLKPDMTILLDIDEETSLRRAHDRHGIGDRLEQETREFHSSVRQAYTCIAKQEPERVKVVDGRGEILSVARRIWVVIEPVLPPITE